MEWMLMPLRRYADFQGRSRRKEYWMFVLFIILCEIPLFIIGGLTGGLTSGTSGGHAGSAGSLIFCALLALFGLAIFIPALAVQIRRFHDQDKSGWFVLLGLIPFIGGLIVLVFMCLEGTRGANRFGPDPKTDGAVA